MNSVRTPQIIIGLIVVLVVAGFLYLFQSTVSSTRASSGRIFYVDASAGNDNNTGTEPSAAWKTLSKVSSTTFLPGDQVLFKRGETFRGRLVIENSGQESNRIVYGAYGNGNKPRITGADVLTDWEEVNPQVWRAKVKYATFAMYFDGVRGRTRTAIAALEQKNDFYVQKVSDTLFYVYVYAPTNPNTFYPNGVEWEKEKRTVYLNADYVTIQDIYFYAGKDALLYINGNGRRNFIILKNIEAYGSSNIGIALRSVSDSIVEDSVISYTGGQYTGIAVGILLYDKTEVSKRNVIRNNRMFMNADAGVRIRSREDGVSIEEWNDKNGYHEIYNNTIYQNGDGIYIHATKFNRIHNNTVYQNDFVKASMVESRAFVQPDYFIDPIAGEGEGIALQSASNNFFYSNRLYNNPNTGFHLWGRIPGVDNYDDGVLKPSWGATHNNVFYKNTIFGNNRNGILLSSTNQMYNTFAYNVIYDNGGINKAGNRTAGIFLQGGLKGNTFYNNTIANNRYAGFDTNTWPGEGTVFANNINALNNTLGESEQSDFLTILFENNCMWDLMTIRIEGTTYRFERGGLNEEQTKSINADPLFVDPQNRNYELRESSRCINAGAQPQLLPEATESVATDILGKAILSTRDIGAFEYNPNAQTQPTVTLMPTSSPLPTVTPGPSATPFPTEVPPTPDPSISITDTPGDPDPTDILPEPTQEPIPTEQPNPTQIPEPTATTPAIPTPTEKVYIPQTTPSITPPVSAQPTQPQSCKSRAQGDADCNCRVNLIDFEYLRPHFVKNDTPYRAGTDFNTDGKISLLDVAIWTATFLNPFSRLDGCESAESPATPTVSTTSSQPSPTTAHSGDHDTSGENSHAMGRWQPDMAHSEKYQAYLPFPKCSKELHDSFRVKGPDGKWYPTWHPPVVTDPATGKECSFGHEHGRNPQDKDDTGKTGSDLWNKVKEHFAYNGDVADSGMPFGYVNEQLDAYNTARNIQNGMRHEDHVGHKIEWENDVPMDISNTPGGLDRTPGDITCDFFMKAHQGTHSKDAFGNNMHELFYFVECTDGTSIAANKMVLFGVPGQFTADPDDKDGNSTITVQGFPVTPQNSMVGRGTRIVPVMDRVRQYVLVPQGQWSTYSQALYEDWISANYLRTADGRQIAYFDPHFAVFSPSRFFFPADQSVDGIQRTVIDRQENMGRSIDVCYMSENNGSERYRGGDCDFVTDYGNREERIAFDDPRSPFNGLKREFYFNQTTIDNTNGPEYWYTDPFGNNAIPESQYSANPDNYVGFVRHYIAPIDNTERYTFESQAIGAGRNYGCLNPNVDRDTTDPNTKRCDVIHAPN